MFPCIERARLPLALAVSTGALLFGALPASAAVPAGNLLTNPGAESGITGWTPTGAFEAVPYGTSGFPTTGVSAAIGGGANFFAGGSSALSTGTQTLDVSGATPEIDAGSVTADLSGYLGGFQN